MRHLVLSVLAAFILSATAAPLYADREIQAGEAACVEVVSESGNTFISIPHRDFRKGGTRIIKKYLEAGKGESYGVVIRNMSAGRIGVVIAVDGRNIISGKRSYLRNSEEMYILNGYEEASYDGWRTDSDTVHRFYFTDAADSYSVKTFEDTSAMGVIAVAVYREKERPHPLYQSKRLQPSPAESSAGSLEAGKAGAARDESAGTGFGNEQYSPTVKVAFEPSSIPVQKTFVKYEWREVLCKRGVLQCRQETRNRLWDGEGYAPYPPGYGGR
jgi:hypothetical protein